MNVKVYFKMLSIMHIALIGGQLVFSVIVIFLILSGNIEPSLVENKTLFLIIAVLFTVGGVYLSNFIYKKQIELIKKQIDFKQKFTKFKTIYILRLIFLEAPSTVAIIFYFLTGSWEFLIFTVAIILISLNLKPNKEKISSEIELSDEVKKLLENPETIISYDVKN